MSPAAHNPTEDNRRTVREASGLGMPQQHIARLIGVSKPTLAKYYRDELDDGKAHAMHKVATTLFQMATSGRDTASTIFWMKTQAGWSTKVRVESEVTQRSGPDLSRLSEDELRQMEALHEKALADDDDIEA